MSKQHKGMRLYLINRDFQLRYTRIAVLVGVASTVLTMGLVLFPLFQLRILSWPYFVPMPFMIGMAVAALLNVVIVAALGIMITHRIAGPMFAVVRYLNLAQTERLSGPLKVREQDDLKYLVRNVNGFFEFLAVRTRRDKGQLEDVIAALKRPDVEGALMIAEGLKEEFAARLPQVGAESA